MECEICKEILTKEELETIHVVPEVLVCKSCYHSIRSVIYFINY